MNISILVDNNANIENAAEHGFSLLIEYPGCKTLFDTGNNLLLHNSELFGVELKDIKNLVISHGHYDHTGGVAELLKKSSPNVYIHSSGFVPRYSINEGNSRPVGISEKDKKSIIDLPFDKLKWISKPVLLADNIGITGPIPRTEEYEDTGGMFFLDPEGKKKDWLFDDVAMWIKTAKGLIICLGCCHSGIVNTVNHIKKLTGTDKVHTIIGGMHLIHADKKRLDFTIANLNQMNIKKLISCHCTGERAVNLLRGKMDCEVISGYSGLKVSFDI